MPIETEFKHVGLSLGFNLSWNLLLASVGLSTCTHANIGEQEAAAVAGLVWTDPHLEL